MRSHVTSCQGCHAKFSGIGIVTTREISFFIRALTTPSGALEQLCGDGADIFEFRFPRGAASDRVAAHAAKHVARKCYALSFSSLHLVDAVHADGVGE